MSEPSSWREIVASAMDWEQAHASLDKAVEGLPADLRGRRARGAPYSIWELLEHIRRAQRDLLEFCRDAGYEETLGWPGDYWPDGPAPASEEEWAECVDAIHRDREDFRRWTVEAEVDLTDRIPHGAGQTYLRTVLVAVDHASYHVGQIVLVRKLLGVWGS